MGRFFKHFAGPLPRMGRAHTAHRMTLQAPSETESHEQLRALYQALLFNQDCFDEFKRLLVLYELDAPEGDAPEGDEEPSDASAVRERLNERIRGWVGGHFEALSAAQVLQWRAIIVEERFTATPSPWRESNSH